jgi:hypothetical protein
MYATERQPNAQYLRKKGLIKKIPRTARSISLLIPNDQLPVMQ